jgi:hypothetical protein
MSTLSERFSAFLAHELGAEHIDTLLGDRPTQGRRADFLCFSRRIVCELKSLEGDPEIRLDGFVNEVKQRPDFPAFVGEAPIRAVLDRMADGEQLKLKLLEKITRQIESAMQNAEIQIESSKIDLNLPGSCGVLFVLNHSIGILDPNVAGFKIGKLFNKKKDGDFRFKNVSFVVFISEAHEVKANTEYGNVMPILEVSGPTATRYPFAPELLASITKKWARAQGAPAIFTAENLFDLQFIRTKDPPNQTLTRQQSWVNDYRTNRYLKSLSDNDLIEHARQIANVLRPHFLVNGVRLQDTALHDALRGWTHALEEAASRALDLRSSFMTQTKG